MNNTIDKKKNKKFVKYALLAAFISSLCCFTPIIFVLLGLATATTAAFWGNYFFFGYWWLMIAIGFVIIAIFLTRYWRKDQVCTLNEVKRNRRKIINSVLIAMTLFILFYILLEILWELIWIKMGLTDWETLRNLLQ